MRLSGFLVPLFLYGSLVHAAPDCRLNDAIFNAGADNGSALRTLIAAGVDINARISKDCPNSDLVWLGRGDLPILPTDLPITKALGMICKAHSLRVVGNTTRAAQITDSALISGKILLSTNLDLNGEVIKNIYALVYACGFGDLAREVFKKDFVIPDNIEWQWFDWMLDDSFYSDTRGEEFFSVIAAKKENPIKDLAGACGASQAAEKIKAKDKDYQYSSHIAIAAHLAEANKRDLDVTDTVYPCLQNDEAAYIIEHAKRFDPNRGVYYHSGNAYPGVEILAFGTYAQLSAMAYLRYNPKVLKALLGRGADVNLILDGFWSGVDLREITITTGIVEMVARRFSDGGALYRIVPWEDQRQRIYDQQDNASVNREIVDLIAQQLSGKLGPSETFNSKSLVLVQEGVSLNPGPISEIIDADRGPANTPIRKARALERLSLQNYFIEKLVSAGANVNVNVKSTEPSALERRTPLNTARFIRESVCTKVSDSDFKKSCKKLLDARIKILVDAGARE